MRVFTTSLILLAAVAAQARPDLRGRVVDAAGRPIAGARVSISTAAVREGTSPY